MPWLDLRGKNIRQLFHWARPWECTWSNRTNSPLLATTLKGDRLIAVGYMLATIPWNPYRSWFPDDYDNCISQSIDLPDCFQHSFCDWMETTQIVLGTQSAWFYLLKSANNYNSCSWCIEGDQAGFLWLEKWRRHSHLWCCRSSISQTCRASKDLLCCRRWETAIEISGGVKFRNCCLPIKQCSIEVHEPKQGSGGCKSNAVSGPAKACSEKKNTKSTGRKTRWHCSTCKIKYMIGMPNLESVLLSWNQ